MDFDQQHEKIPTAKQDNSIIHFDNYIYLTWIWNTTRARGLIYAIRIQKINFDPLIINNYIYTDDDLIET